MRLCAHHETHALPMLARVACCDARQTNPAAEAMMRTAIICVCVLTWSACAGAETHRFVPTTYHNTFSFAHAPALRIKPGDRVITVTIDAAGMDANGRRVASGPNPETGPFYIEGAESGDTIVVTLNRIEPNRGTAISNTLLAPYTVCLLYTSDAADER